MAELSGPVRENYEDASKGRGPCHILLFFLERRSGERRSVRNGDNRPGPQQSLPISRVVISDGHLSDNPINRHDERRGERGVREARAWEYTETRWEVAVDRPATLR
jgi:hypothetical protein